MIPERNVIKEAVYDELSKRDEIKLKDLYESTAKSLKLTSDDLNIKDKFGEIHFYHEVRWCLQTLKTEKRAVRVGRGVWSTL